MNESNIFCFKLIASLQHMFDVLMKRRKKKGKTMFTKQITEGD